MAVNVVSFSFSTCSTGGPGVHSAGCWLSLLYLIRNFSGPQTPSGFPRAPSAGCGFPYHISSISISNSTATACRTQLYCLLFNSSALYYLQTPTQRYGHASTPPQFLPISGDRDVSLPLSLEWPVRSSLSGNNCHAVHRSLSSGASVYEWHFGTGRRSKHNTQTYPIYRPLCSGRIWYKVNFLSGV